MNIVYCLDYKAGDTFAVAAAVVTCLTVYINRAARNLASRILKMEVFDTEKFIVLVQSKTCLWDVTDNAYKDRDKKITAWQKILEEMCPNHNSWSPEERRTKGAELQKKWKNIKDRFTKDLKNDSKSGSAASKKKKYVFFDMLQFLVPQTQQRNTESNVVEEVAESPESENTEETEDVPERSTPSIERPAIPSRKKKSFEDRLLSLLENKQQPSGIEDDDLNFFKSLLPIVKTLTEQQKLSFRIEIMQLLQRYTSTTPQPSFNNQFRTASYNTPIFQPISRQTLPSTSFYIHSSQSNPYSSRTVQPVLSPTDSSDSSEILDS